MEISAAGTEAEGAVGTTLAAETETLAGFIREDVGRLEDRRGGGRTVGEALEGEREVVEGWVIGEELRASGRWALKKWLLAILSSFCVLGE